MPKENPNPNPNSSFNSSKNESMSKKKKNIHNCKDDDDEEKQRTTYDFCKVCRLNHNQGRRHIYFPNHKKALSSFLSGFQSKLKNDVAFFLKNPIPLRPEHASLNRLWCVFCDSEILESNSSFACGNTIEHLASAEHIKEVKSFLWKYGGGMDRVDSFRITESDFAKWEKKWKLMKTEAASEGSHGSLIGPSNDIHNETKFDCANSFDKNKIHSLTLDINYRNGFVPLQNHINERSQVSHSKISRVGPQIHHMYVGTDVGLGARSPKCLLGYFGNQHFIHSLPKEDPAYSYPVNGSVYPYGSIANGESSKGTSSQESSSHGLLNLTQISSSAREDSGGNVHSGAPPPWFSENERIQLDNKLNCGLSDLGSSVGEPVKSSKLNPKRVGAAWAERRKIELELEKRGELVRNNFDADWLPNFGRVWQSGSRKESRKEFLGENNTWHKVDSQIEKPSQLQPYISKRMVAEIHSSFKSLDIH